MGRIIPALSYFLPEEALERTWYDLYNGTDESNWLPMTNATDLSTEFDTPKAAGADGIIVWGAGKDASTVARCGNMARYFERTLGPKLLAVGGRRTTVWSGALAGRTSLIEIDAAVVRK